MHEHPNYNELHGALKEELSPSRIRKSEVRASSRPVSEKQTDPRDICDARSALDALLKSRSELAKKMHAVYDKPSTTAMAVPGAGAVLGAGAVSLLVPSENDPVASSLTLHTMLEPIAAALGLDLAELEDIVSDDLPSHPSLVSKSSVATEASTPQEKAKYVVEKLLEERPWLAGGLDDVQATAASHLLLYAEGLQCFRQKYSKMKHGDEVDGPHGEGVVVEVAGDCAWVKFSDRTEVVPLSTLSIRHRRIVPVEAVEKWGDEGMQYPSKAAHTKVRPARSEHGAPQDLEKVLRPLMKVMGDDATLSVSNSECFTQHDLSFHMREGSKEDSVMSDDRSAYQSIAGMIGTHVQVIDDPAALQRYCSVCYDMSVDAGSVIPKAGCVARVAEVNIVTSTARLLFTTPKSTNIWFPLRALTVCNPDPMLAMGCRATSISVLGNPSQHEISQAARAISALEYSKKASRRAVTL